MDSDDLKTIPVIEERAVVRKHVTAQDAVRVRTIVHVDEEVVDTTVSAEEIDVERVVLDQWLEAPVPVRQEGDTTIITLHQEVVVTEKRLKAIGEVRMTKRLVARPASERVALRREEAVVERAAITPDETNVPS
jgi:stress response protein YsnF